MPEPTLFPIDPVESKPPAEPVAPRAPSIPPDAVVPAIEEDVRRLAAIVLSWIQPARIDALPSALELVGALRADSEQLAIVAGGLTAVQNSEQLRQAGCTLVCATISEGRRAIRNRIVERMRLRRARWISGRAAKPTASQPGRI